MNFIGRKVGQAKLKAEYEEVDEPTLKLANRICK